jgi:hypothetical protein
MACLAALIGWGWEMHGFNTVRSDHASAPGGCRCASAVRTNGASPQPDEACGGRAGFGTGSRRDLRSERPTAAARYADA